MAGYSTGMAVISFVLASSTADSESAGLFIIGGTVLLILLAIAAVWTFAARRASRVPKREPQRPDQGVRGKG